MSHRTRVSRARVVACVAVTAAAGVAGSRALEALAAEPPRHTIDVSRALDAGAATDPSPRDIAITPTPPDPPPLVEQAQWVFDLRWDRGDVFLLGVHPLRLPAPQATPRAMGRFALELFEGPALLERVRFDFPLLGAGAGLNDDAGISFASKLRTRIGVVFPASPRGTRLELVDRATGRRYPLPWPPQETGDGGVHAAGAADGGVHAAGTADGGPDPPPMPR
ncbi:MAG: hypothetical protein JOZ69_08055 [Myxococcales bacterium]|nr:hypothetical protein [Myxococcales bacterium]